jgi:uncharacterized protein
MIVDIENLDAFRQIGRVKLTYLFALALLAAVLAGCGKTDTGSLADKSANPQPDSLPTQAQPMLQTVKIYLGAETLDAEQAVTAGEEETGLMYRTNITDETAMIFALPQPQQAAFWMTNCPISLSAAYIGPDGVIEEIHHLEKDDNVPVFATNDNIYYVLEVNDGWFARHNIAPGTLIRTERGSLAQTFRGGN